jgi:DNA replication protein DnaC
VELGSFLLRNNSSIYRWQERLSGLKKTFLLFALTHQFLQQLIEGDELYTRVHKTDLRMLDDGGRAPLSDEKRRDLLDIVEDRHACRATRVTSQLPVEHWHEALGEPTLADAILDRLVPNAYKITVQGAHPCGNGRRG